MKVLIVDDEEEICTRLQRELQKEGYVADYTTSPVDVMQTLREAKKKGRENAYELLTLNIQMPQLSGFELLKQIREAHLDLDVIIITGYGDEDKAIEAIHLGAIDYLRKPISLEELQTAVFRVRQKRAAAEKKAVKHRVLVVDDEKDLCERIKRELDKEGCYEVAVAYDGVEGLEYFKNNRVDVAIADIKMPRMNGLGMLDKCREITNDFVSIVITGYGDHETAIEALKLGAFNYIKKPISLDELITSVGKGIDVLELRRGLSARKRELEIEGGLKERYAKDLEMSVDVIKKTSDKLQRILDTVSEALSIFDRDLAVLDVNGTLLRIFGLKREEAIGKKCYEAFWNRDKICEGCPVPSIFETGKESRMEKTIELADGTKKYVDIIHVPIFDVRGNVVQVLCDMRDLTERKGMEEKLLRSERLAAIGELSGNVAHELRQPLGVISNAIYYLKMVLAEADETTKEYLDMINNEVKSAGDTITGLLEIARTRPAERHEVEVSSVIEKALEKFEMHENITLNKDIPADIPAIFADRGQIAQVFYNLINNALQAMSMPEREGRGGELTINVKPMKKKGKAMVEVSFGDTGVGISKENLKKLFEPLFTTKARGVGLGLSICKNLVENNGGEIEVQSEEGKGTTVTVSLPAAMAMKNPKS